MKRPQIIGIGVAGIAGLLAFVMMQGFVNQPPPEPETVEIKAEMEDVLVAKHPLGLGQITEEQQLGWHAWPKDAVTGDFVTRSRQPDALSEYAGTIARAPVLKGEPITSSKLVKPGQGGVLASILSKGMRAISTRIKEETAAGNLILPNDRVDVILTRQVQNRLGAEEAVSETLFQNIRVLAMGQQIDSGGGKAVSDISASTATLELNARQSEQLALANTMGELSLALRSIADSNPNGNGSDENESVSLREADVGPTIRVLRYGINSRLYDAN